MYREYQIFNNRKYTVNTNFAVNICNSPSVPIPLEWIVIGVGVIGVSVIIAGLYWLKRRK